MSNEQITVVKNMAAQGDMMIRRINKLPEGLTKRESTKGQHILAHSETGHHHSVADEVAVVYDGPEKDMICYLSIEGEHADIIHHRSFDTHKPLRLTKGTYEIRRQREHTPAGWRRVED